MFSGDDREHVDVFFCLGELGWRPAGAPVPAAAPRVRVVCVLFVCVFLCWVVDFTVLCLLSLCFAYVRSLMKMCYCLELVRLLCALICVTCLLTCWDRVCHFYVDPNGISPQNRSKLSTPYGSNYGCREFKNIKEWDFIFFAAYVFRYRCWLEFTFSTVGVMRHYSFKRNVCCVLVCSYDRMAYR